MSWASDVADRIITRGSTETLGGKLAGKAFGRRRTREMVAAAIGGSHGLQYAHSRNRGMSGSEAQGNTLTRGFAIQQYRGQQKARVAEENQREADADLQRERVAEEARARGQIAARVRRGSREPRYTKGGTMTTGPGGLGGTGAGGFGAFAALLGL